MRMKSALFFLLSVGLTTSSSPFKPGYEYAYSYSGKILTGIPEIDTTFAGMSITGQVIVQSTGIDSFKLAMQEVGMSTFNDKMSGSDPVNWRNVITPKTNPLVEEYQQHIESPTEFTIENGEISTMLVSNTEPLWSINFKKALIANLKIQLPGADMSPFWKKMEQGIEGKCENTYQILELPEYLIHEYEHEMLKPELCQGKKFYQIIKTRDITNCLDRSVFVSGKAHAKCLLGNCDKVNTKSSLTRYFGCGQSTESVELQSMIGEGELQQNVLAFNTEPVITGTQQVLKLLEVAPITTVLPKIDVPRILKNLFYEFPKPVNTQITNNVEQGDYYKALTSDPVSQVFLPAGSFENSKKGKMINKLVDKLVVIAQQLSEVENFGKKEVPSQLKSLKTVVSVLTTADLNVAYSKIQGLTLPKETKETARTLLVDTVSMAGTSPALMFVKEIIETKQVTDTEALVLIATLAHNIKTPTTDLIDQLFELIKSPAVTGSPVLKYHAHLVFATILRKACLSDSLEQVFPEYVFGEMCSPNHIKIKQVFIPYLVKDLKDAQDAMKQMGAITVLGVLGHESTLPLLLEYIEGKSFSFTPAVRSLAIYCLDSSTPKYKNLLLPVYTSIIHNPSEQRGIRIAALSMLLKMQPEIVHLQRLAVATWFEKDVEMHKFIYYSLRSLSHIKLVNLPEGSHLKDLCMKAQTVLPLAKPVAGIISSTFATYVSGVISNLNVGYQMMSTLVPVATNQHFYHRMELFLKQVHTTPLEFAINIRGVSSLLGDLANSFSHETSSYLEQIHPEWKNIIQKLQISPSSDTPFEAALWAKLNNDIQFVFVSNFKGTDIVKDKIVQSLKEPSKLFDQVCKKTPLNLNKVMEVLPYQALIPSDLGLPIIVETQATYLVSLKGEIDVDCSKASVAIKIAKKAAVTYSGYVGTVSPFTGELIAAGMNEHRAVNVPIQASIDFIPVDGSIKIALKQIDDITPTTKAIDVHHYHMMPFTAIKPVVFADMTPVVLHENTKILRSIAKRKNFEAKFGEIVGLDMYFKIDTESDLYDYKAMIDAWASYEYNPMVASLFSFTQTAIKSNGMPTGRFHEYSFILNPEKSVTKAAEMKIKVSLASKKKSDERQGSVFMMQSANLQTNSPQELSLKECINNLKSEQSIATNIFLTAKLIGSNPMTYTYSVTLGHGTSNLDQKWNLHMETDAGHLAFRKICINGAMKAPIIPNSDVKFKYFNHIGFGQTCDEYFVNIDGTSSVGEKQKQYSRSSVDAKKCDKMTIESQIMLQQIRALDQGLSKKSLQKKYAKIVDQQLQVCETKNDQKHALDETVIDITTSDVLPDFVKEYGRLVNSGLKIFLFEYIAQLPVYKQSKKIQVKLNFNQKLNTMTMLVQSPVDVMLYKNIRLPMYLHGVLPLIATKNPLEQSYKALSSSALHGKCILGQGYIQTFDKKTYSYQVDNCQHVLSADCSKKHSHSILVREVSGQKQVVIYHGLSKISFTPSYSTYTLEVDGEEVKMVLNKQVYINSKDAKSIYSVILNGDNSLVLETPSARITHTGNEVIVEEKSILADGSHCGLCGDYNNDIQADIKSPKGCIYKSQHVTALSYRINSSQCRLSSQQQELLLSEQQKCVQYKVQRTPVSNLYKSFGSSSVKRHSFIYQGDKLCISQQPLVQCVQGSFPQALTTKSVKFVCLPKGRVSKLYADRVERGESPQELKQQPVAFQSQVTYPISCEIPQL